MDKYDVMYQAFMSKANIIGMEIDFEKQKNGLYMLTRLETNSNVLTLTPFVSKIDLSVLDGAHNLTELYLPKTLTSLRIYGGYNITKYNIPEKIKGLYNFGKSQGDIEVTLEGCRKSVQPGFAGYKSKLNIINSQLIERVNSKGFYSYEKDSGTTVKELRLLDTIIDSYAFTKMKLNKLYISKYSKISTRAFVGCYIDELYFFVETQEEANKINNLFYNEVNRISQFSNCKIKRLITVIRPMLKQDIYNSIKNV